MIVRAAAFPLDDSIVVLNPSGDRVHLLDPAARAVWEAFAAGLTEEEIAAAAAASPCGGEKTEQGIQMLLRGWREQGLLAGSAPPAPCLPPEEPLQRADDDADWPVHAEDDFRLRDMVIRVRSGDAAIRQAAWAMLSHLAAKPEDGAPETMFSLRERGGVFLLVQDGCLLAEKDSLDGLMTAFSLAAGDMWHRRRDGWLLIAHAAAVERGGACILLPAQGGSGKTTLAAFLLRRGFSLLSDDIVPILRGTGQAAALPFCLHIKQGSIEPLRAPHPQLAGLHPYPWGQTRLRFLPPPDFQQAAADASWPVSRIIFPHYEPSAATQLAPLSAAETFRRLIEAEPLLPRPLLPDMLEELTGWVKEKPAHALRYSSLEAAAAVLGDFK